MIGKIIGTTAAAAIAMTCLAVPAHAQQLPTYSCQDVTGTVIAVYGRYCTALNGAINAGPFVGLTIIKTADGRVAWECGGGIAALPALVNGVSCEPA